MFCVTQKEIFGSHVSVVLRSITKVQSSSSSIFLNVIKVWKDTRRSKSWDMTTFISQTFSSKYPKKIFTWICLNISNTVEFWHWYLHTNANQNESQWNIGSVSCFTSGIPNKSSSLKSIKFSFKTPTWVPESINQFEFKVDFYIFCGKCKWCLSVPNSPPQC